MKPNILLDDGELCLIALNGLDLSYDAFITTQMATTDNISFATFQGLLLAHEDMAMKPV